MNGACIRSSLTLAILRVMDVDSHQRVLLSSGEGAEKQVLKTRVAYDQLKPVRTSHLHNDDQTTEPTNAELMDPEELDVLQDPFENDPTSVMPLCDEIMKGVSADPVPTNEAPTEGATGQAAFHGVSAYSLSEKLAKKKCKGVAVHQKSAELVPINEVSTEGATSAAAIAFVDLMSSPSLIPEAAEGRTSKRKRLPPTDMDEVLFEGRSGPARRRVEVLPVQPAFECTSETLMRGMLRILNGAWELTDEHMDHCSFLLKKQHPHVDGLQRMSVFESQGCQRVGTPQDRFVQVLLVGCHWITVSNMLCQHPGEILVYDSIYDRTPKSYRKEFLAKVGWLLHTAAPQITLMWPDVSKQRGNKDCGLFALANAGALCEGVPPEECDWDQARMRLHLTSCFRSGAMSLFPCRKQRTHQGIVHQEIEPVFCHCRQPYTGRAFEVCAACSCKYHKRGCGEKLPTSGPFVCKGCQ